MGRSLMTPKKTTDMSTAPFNIRSSVDGTALTSSGLYIKTGGSSNIDATRLIFWVTRNSSKCSSTGLITVVAGSTDGNTDFQPGLYSTLRNLDMTIAISTRVYRSGKIFFFVIPETARFKDTDGYIKFNCSTDITSGTAASTGGRMGAIYVSP